VNGFAVFERHNAKRAPSEVWDDTPMPNPAVGLDFLPQWICDYPFAPFVPDVGPFSQHLFFEVTRGLHGSGDYR
jgi:hypothetical protein